MTKVELEERVRALERQIAELRALIEKHLPNMEHPNPFGPWWREGAGRFAGDPVFEEIVRLGREYRKSTHPDAVKKQKRKVVGKNARP